MTRSWRFLFLGLAVFLVSALPSRAQVELPKLSRPVIDTTGTLTAEEAGAIEGVITALQSEKGSQIAVLITDTTEPETIEQFGIRLAESWKIGRAKVDDGVILIVAKNDRTVRIEVGYGLEGAIPDAIAKRIIEERIIPEFRSGNFANGVQSGVDALAAIIKGEELPPPPAPSADSESSEGALTFLIFLGVFVCAVLGEKLGRVGGAITGSLLMGGIGALILGIGLGIFLAVILLFIGLSPQGKAGRRGRGGSRSSGWSSGGGFSGGGFSGGGGSFGGGGASGRW
ncbi:MAG: hypothetical protein RL417_567 [Pseudomonadota bacterium]|jgi:uncharacterized protein